jgi:hypothetical protein
MIQVFTRTRNIDSKVRTPRFNVSNLNSTAGAVATLQQYRHFSDLARCPLSRRYRRDTGHGEVARLSPTCEPTAENRWPRAKNELLQSRLTAGDLEAEATRGDPPPLQPRSEMLARGAKNL